MENKKSENCKKITDESDSGCIISKKIYQNDSGGLIKSNSNEQITPTIIVQKPSQLPPTKIVKVKPVSSISNNNNNIINNNSKPRIDKIVDNLKINLLNKPSSNNDSNKSPPKVSIVNIKSVVNDHKEDKKISKQDEEILEEDDLTSLNWLNTFNLNIKPLSPPESPQFENDEADGGHIITKKASFDANIKLESQNKPVISTSPRQKLTTNNNTINTTSQQVQINENLIKLIGILNRNPAYLSTPKRPPYSFSFLIYMAIESSERKRLSVKDIYSWVTDNFPYYRNVPSGSWKNSIRHNLSFNKSFAKVDKNLLAMRDFSGKGSLWCINPESKPLIQDALAKTQNHEQISYFEDVVLESPKTTTTSSNISYSSPNNQQPTTVTLNKSLINNCKNILLSNKSNKKRFSVENAKPAILNPNLLNRIKPGITPVKNRSSSTLSIDSNSQSSTHQNSNSNSLDECCTEMDAVNALLSMKARSSSMPINFSNNKTHEIKNSHLDLDSSNRGGRRKQVFKTPIKRKISQEILFERANTTDEDDSYNSYDLDVSIDEEEFMDDDYEEEMEMYKNNRKQANNKRFIVKLPLFTKPLANKSNVNIGATNQYNYSESEEENEDDYDENKSLKIDQDNNIEKEQLKNDQLETGSTKSSSSASSSCSSSKTNALLELSMAASLIIESNQNEQDKTNKKSKKLKPNEEESSQNTSNISTRSRTILTRSKTSNDSESKSLTRKKTN